MLGSARKLKARLSKNIFMSIWFILLTVATAWAMLFLAHMISTDSDLRDSDLIVRPNTFLLFIFLILTGKALIETLHRAVESKELLFLLNQPVPTRKILMGKFLGVLYSNLSVVTYALVLLTVLQVSSFHLPGPALTITADMPSGTGGRWVGGYGINHYNILDIIILTILASTMGFVYSIFNSLPWRKRVSGVAIYSILITPLVVIMRELAFSPPLQTTALFVIMLVSFLGLYPASGVFLEAWTRETSGKRSKFFQKRSWGSMRFLEALLPSRIARVVKKELVINVQKKEIVGNLIAILSLSGLLIWGWHRIEGLEDIPGRVAVFAYPAIIGIGIYLACILQCGLIGLGSIGKEGKKFWILKSLPIHPERIYWAKAVAIFTLSPVTILGVALPLPLILGYSISWILFFIAMTISLIMAFTGVGLMMGTLYPNFDESTGGMPDVMSMYLLMLFCLVIGGGLIIFAGLAMAQDPIKGLMAIVITLEIGFIILVIGIKLGSWVYSKIEPE